MLNHKCWLVSKIVFVQIYFWSNMKQDIESVIYNFHFLCYKHLTNMAHVTVTMNMNDVS